MKQSQGIPVAVLCIVLALSLGAQPVHRYDGAAGSLDQRWDWALQQSAQTNQHEGFWIGYRIKRLMREDSYISSGNSYFQADGNRKNLRSLVEGDTVPTLRVQTEFNRQAPEIYKRMKDLAILFQMESGPDGSLQIRKVDECTMDLAYNLRNKPLYWLGPATDDASVHRLEELFGENSNASVKKEFVEAIGLHQSSGEAFPFLSNVVAGNEKDDVRAQAAFWLGEQGQSRSLTILLKTAQNDKSLKVRGQAVFAISRMDTAEATDALILLARRADNPKIRGKAAFWLGQQASRKALETLENIVEDDEETQVQRQALFALAQMKDGGGVDLLVKIATTHPNPRIRKQAIELLGQSDDPRALDALIAIVRK